MVQDIPAPPEAEVIKLARMAARLTPAEAAAKVRTAGGKISDTYWRDIERGHGGRRGMRVPARVSDGLLAQMADAVGVTPAQLTGSGREDAARVLEEILRREPAERDAEVISFPAAASELVKDMADARLADIEDELGGPVDVQDKVERAIVGQHKTPQQIARELREWRLLRSDPSEGRGASRGR